MKAHNHVVKRSDRQRVFQWKVLGGRPVTTAVRRQEKPIHKEKHK